MLTTLPREKKLYKNFSKCFFVNDIDKGFKLGKFLGEYGDGLPPDALKKATTVLLDNFQTICNENNDIVSAGTWEKNDWYLCTIRYLATDKNYRKKGLGTLITKRVVNDALKSKTYGNDSCLVLAGDVTSDNTPSKKIFKTLGFKEVSKFYWSPNEKPADILHYIRYKSPESFKK